MNELVAGNSAWGTPSAGTDPTPRSFHQLGQLLGGKHYTKDNFQQSVMNYVANFAALEVDHRLAHILNLVMLTKQGQPFILGISENRSLQSPAPKLEAG